VERRRVLSSRDAAPTFDFESFRRRDRSTVSYVFIAPSIAISLDVASSSTPRAFDSIRRAMVPALASRAEARHTPTRAMPARARRSIETSRARELLLAIDESFASPEAFATARFDPREDAEW
jgi:hypothetical protein